ncbi:alpha-1,3-rhamnosyl/mannosyltransferase [Pseudomonas asturiensis]|uniref:Alpha-1,3-rhamnosyl/mannosyltransferase n=1 Tax=Pseudomonas asturiensis TaxID=1190415 RepID=A0A1M7JUS2_9PSED|nr:glycosyltransferase family 1 protein [Pseudomonas asturiensis]SHM56738.1 alpha-1,3-rhamnosyl/mannosyltransferase [Pseudomonas asturiensis]
MRLLLNIESLIPPLTGIGNYTFNLIEQLQAEDIEKIDCFIGARHYSAERALTDCIHASSVYAQRSGSTAFSLLHDLLRRSTLAYRTRELVRNTQLRVGAHRFRQHVYHEPNFMLKAYAGKSVATIHDLSFIYYPQLHPPKRVEWLSAQLPRTLERADFLITDSDIIRDELISDFGVGADRVKTVYLGAAEVYRPHTGEQTRSTLERYKLTQGRYVLFVGTIEPRKGVGTLLEAWSRLPLAVQQDFPLVLAGANGWRNQPLNDRIKAMAASHGVRQLSFVPRHDLPALYAGAAVFAYPSLYEGFGLPVLEAMQSGVASICTAGTSMAEFTQGCAVLVERGNHEQLAAHLNDLLGNETLRNAVAQAGLARAQAFSWQRCARETLDIYRAVG